MKNYLYCTIKSQNPPIYHIFSTTDTFFATNASCHILGQVSIKTYHFGTYNAKANKKAQTEI